MWICTMWTVLLFVFVSTAAAVPVDPTQVPSPSSTGTTGNVTLLNPGRTHSPPPSEPRDVTSSGETTSTSPPGADSAETLEEHDQEVAVQEGDILMQDDRNAVNTLWPDAAVPYHIAPDVADRLQDIQAAAAMISDVTCLRFKERSTELNYLKIRRGRGCASYVGCQGGAQSLFLAPSCSVGNLVHELIHAAGLHHEHTRPDRDGYLSVGWTNIKPGKENNFQKKRGNTLELPYDIGSIMHYGPFFFSQNGSPTLTPKTNGGEQMGQRSHLSPLDAQKLNSLYRCAERRPQAAKPHSPAEASINSQP